MASNINNISPKKVLFIPADTLGNELRYNILGNLPAG